MGTTGKLPRLVRILAQKIYSQGSQCIIIQVKKEMTIPGEDEPTGIIQPLKENIALGLEQAKAAAT